MHKNRQWAIKWFYPFNWVRQDDNLSPNLFKFYVNDLVDSFELVDDPVFLSNYPISSMLYADDLILLSTSGKVFIVVKINHFLW